MTSSLSRLIAFAFLLLAFTSTDQVLGEEEESRVATGWSLSSVLSERVLPQRRLVGPGSSPPSCVSKCGSCSPCERVLITIPPGWNLPSDEYRPRAWRCKCGGSSAGESGVKSGRSVASGRALSRTRLAKPSSMPSCVSKCRGCLPCQPVLVTDPPPPILALDDYQSQVWRCKCGDRLYIP